MSPEAEPNVNPLIWAAIEQKRLLRFRYKNRERIVEPHDYGIHNGLIKLFGYQVGGSSSQKTTQLAVGGAGPGLGYRVAEPDFSRWASYKIGQTSQMGQAVHSESNQLITTR